MDVELLPSLDLDGGCLLNRDGLLQHVRCDVHDDFRILGRLLLLLLQLSQLLRLSLLFLDESLD